jgi:hypothetical protein
VSLIVWDNSRVGLQSGFAGIVVRAHSDSIETPVRIIPHTRSLQKNGERVGTASVIDPVGCTCPYSSDTI